ncbi:hypothetical protein BDN70DRAFT_10947 [Pholiota conissans]|uniref:Uncharacterized protein n=1 Tax=Pholiota conissans TaxID=109636 RepID=A0A9P6CZH5_9AGAR|nr:hypothetical protein BDN70DRAFT_10947 [Pholiota conissans]
MSEEGSPPSNSRPPTPTPGGTVGPAQFSFTLTNSQWRELMDKGQGSFPSLSGSSHSATATTIPPFVPGPATEANSQSCESLTDQFPYISRATIIEIIRFEFHPLNVYKLDLVSHDKAAETRNTLDIEDGSFTVRERTGSAKDYPNFASLLEPLLTYFEILGAYAASSGSASSTLAILRGCNAYCAHLSCLNRTYTWSAILQYHKHFFLKRSKEMARSNFSGWLNPDANLMSQFLFGHVRPVTSTVNSASKSKSSSSSSATSSKTPLALQTCFPFNKGTCTGSVCPAGRIHKCSKCDATSHGSSTCTKAT